MDGLDGLKSYPLARRGMMMTGLISGLTLATTRVEAQVIHTDPAGLDAGEAKIPTSDGALPAYYARPAGAGPFPTVLVIEEIFGVHEYIKDTCRRLAKLGYLAVAPELYARIGDLSKMTDAALIVRDVISKAPDDRLLRTSTPPPPGPRQQGRPGPPGRDRLLPRRPQHLDVRRPQPGAEGGRRLVRPGRGQAEPDPAEEPRRHRRRPEVPAAGPVRRPGHRHRRADVQAAAAKAKAAGKTVEIVVFPDAPHGFHADYRPSYRKADAEDGWARMLAWFKKNGV